LAKKCGECRQQFTAEVGTVFEHARMPLHKMLQAVHLMISSKKVQKTAIGAPMADDPKIQLDKFKQAARDLETDDDPQRFNERLGKLVKHRPVEKPE
jgi:hypothetical protein